MREFRDADGVAWVVFFTARSVARDHHLPEEYREGWLSFESSTGEKRRLAPAPTEWQSLSDEQLATLSARAAVQPPRKKGSSPPTDLTRDLDHAESPESLQPKLRELETKLSTALDEVCELPPAQKLNTGELIRVEETLALATAAAKDAVSLRRKLHADRDRKLRDGPQSQPLADDHHA